MRRGVGGSKVWGEVREMRGEMWAVGKIRGDMGRSMGVVGRWGGNAERGGDDVQGLGEVW